MPVYYDTQKKRWRFTFNRIISLVRTRATKLLPAGWSRAQAEKYDREETARLYAIASGLERPEPTIGQAGALYLEYRIPRLRNGRKAARDMAHLIDYVDGQPLSKLPEIALQYAKDHPELAPATIRNRLAYWKAACRYAWKKHNLTEHDPTGRMELPAVSNVRDVQTPVSRLEQLIRAIDDDEARAIFTLAFRTGSRWRNSIYPRKPEDVERHGADVWLRIGITKNGTPRMKWVHPDARWTLKYLPFEHCQEYYYDRFCKARALVGMEDHTAHDMRHILATDILKRRGTLPDVSAALDHISLASSARYAHIVPPHVKSALSKVGGRRKMHTARASSPRKRAA